MSPRLEVHPPPVASAPGVGISPAVAPTSYVLKRARGGLKYEGLVDPVNARLTVKLPQFADAGTFAADVLRAARSHEMTKVLLYATAGQWQKLLAQGFVLEGVLDGVPSDLYLMGYLFTNERWTCGNLEREQTVLEAALATEPEAPVPLDPRYQLLRCGPEMAAELAAVFQAVFTTFPTPLNQPDFTRTLIESGIGTFWAVSDANRIVSVAATEVDRGLQAAEVTNCATLPSHRGEGLIQVLLVELEQEMQRQGISSLFSIARAASFGMNRALRKAGYGFRGRLRCNSHIMGGFEDMNLWVRRLENRALPGAH